MNRAIMKQISEKLNNKLDSFIEKIPCLKQFLEITNVRDNREKNSKLRTIYVNNIQPEDYNLEEEPLAYANNKIITSKYTLWNFVPKNLFEQFRRIANFYFLINAIIIFIIPDPPTNPFASAFPLIIVIAVTAIKQAYEDVIRHREDKKQNNSLCRVLRNGGFKTVKSKDIICGDIIEVERDSCFPCDILLLYSKSDNDTCYIKTSNLDGETNLKVRYVPNNLPCFKSETDLIDLRGVISCEKPNARLYEFKGKFITNKTEISLSNLNILLRGTCLKIAPVIYGCAVYTGRDTKMMLNSKFKSNKLSCVERRLNRFVLIYLSLLIVLTLACLFGAIIYESNGIYRTNWYLTGREPSFYSTNSSVHFFITFIFYMNINYLVPLSMYVTIEIQRFIGSQFFEWDIHMYNSKTDEAAKVNSSDLNEDLGQIEYLFSDKTGTLTENEMVFKHFALNGHIYQEKKGIVYKVGSDEPEIIENDTMIKLIECLTLCHTVQLDLSSEDNYNASSPDELSFIKFCAKLGIVYEGDQILKEENKTIRKITYYVDKSRHYQKVYDLLHTLEFDSTRKRMSVIVRSHDTGEYILFCKGADNAVFKKLKPNEDKTETEHFLHKFSSNGWRTLVLSYKILSREQFDSYDLMLNKAKNEILDRDAKLLEAFELIETDLTLNGVTAVEDRLQEDVETTLQLLREAGIKIWVLTGDKLETAVNISNSCRHFSKEMLKIELSNMDDSFRIKEKLDQFIKDKEIDYDLSYALIVDGYTLGYMFEGNLEDEFRELAMKCDAVLCCRMTPAQKAQIVKLIKHSVSQPMTAAIGDGANDVSMIQEANVGIGLFGKEGRNAAISADFAFAKFKYLKRAFLVHGYLYYTRASMLVLYFFYKNFVFAICQAYYAFWNAFSTGSLYNSLFLSMFNLAITSVPVFVLGLVEQRTPIDTLAVNPKYYKTISKNNGLSFKKFFLWTIIGIWHSLVAFFFPVFHAFINSAFLANGQVGGGDLLGAMVVFNIFLIVHIKIFLIWRHQNFLALVSYLLSIGGFVVCLIIPNSVLAIYPFSLFTDGQNAYYIFFKLFESIQFWFSVLVTLMAALAPDIAIKCIEHIEEANLFKLEKTKSTTTIEMKPTESNDNRKLFELIQKDSVVMPINDLTGKKLGSNSSLKTIQSVSKFRNNFQNMSHTKVIPFRNESSCYSSFKSTNSTFLGEETNADHISSKQTKPSNKIQPHPLISSQEQSLHSMDSEDIQDILEPAHDTTSASYV